jgi:LDH2 family malate/lactate/ureidoglycolate dehydrogenase
MTAHAAPQTYAHDRVEQLVTAILVGLGLPERDARRSAQCLVLADLRGVASHGVGRLPIYADRIRQGLINATPSLTLEEPMPAAARLDGDNGFGFVVATKAMNEAVERASRYGIGMVSAYHSTHFGMAACYLLQAIEKGYAAFVLTNASPAMPVWGGSRPFLGTSPFAFGAPGAEGLPPIVLDMATSVVARGKIRRAAANGESIPEGWALDKDGRPTTDAQAGYDGIVLPLGGPKGSGLSLMMEVMAGVVSGAAYGGQVRNQYFDFDAPQNVGHTMIAIKPDLFEPDYGARMADLVTRAKAEPLVDETQPILMPGEPEGLREAQRRKTGIALPAEDLAALRSEAEKAGVDFGSYL